MSDNVRRCHDFHYCPGASVQAEIQGRHVHLEPRRALVEPGATVTWRFSGVPQGHQPLIRFTGEAGLDTGPFELLGLATDRIVGLGSDGAREEECEYEVVLVPLTVGEIQVLKGGGSVVRMVVDPPDRPADG